MVDCDGPIKASSISMISMSETKDSLWVCNHKRYWRMDERKQGGEESLWQYDNKNINNLNTLFYPSSTISYRVLWDFKSIKQGQRTLNRWTTLITKTKLRISSPAPVSLILLERSRTWQLSCERLQSVLGRSRDIILSEIPRNYPERYQ